MIVVQRQQQRQQRSGNGSGSGTVLLCSPVAVHVLFILHRTTTLLEFNSKVLPSALDSCFQCAPDISHHDAFPLLSLACLGKLEALHAHNERFECAQGRTTEIREKRHPNPLVTDRPLEERLRKGLIILLKSAAEARLRPSQCEEQAAERGHVREGLGPIRQPKVKSDHLLRAHRYARQLGSSKQGQLYHSYAQAKSSRSCSACVERRPFPP